MAPRHSFLPPLYPMASLSANDSAEWGYVSPIPLLTDWFGEEVPEGAAQIRLGWCPTHLQLRAAASAPPTPLLPRSAPGDADFWRQEHVDFQWQRSGGERIQFILAPDGRLFVSDASAQGHDGLSAAGTVGQAGWQATLSIPWAVLGVAAPAAGMQFAGQIAHVRWSGKVPCYAVFSATPLGFSQAERHGAFVLAAPGRRACLQALRAVGSPLRCGPNAFAAVLTNPGTETLRGLFQVECDHAHGAAPAVSCPVALPPGETELPLGLHLERPRYTRYTFWLRTHEGSTRLGAVTLRGTAAPLPPGTAGRRHPYLFFDSDGLAALRRKATRPAFAALREALAKRPDVAARLPAAGEAVSLAITRTCMNWFRVAKETMLRDGEGRRTPKAAYLWSRFSPAGQAMWRSLRETVKPTDEQLAVLIPECNALLARRDFYNAAAFAGVALPDEAEDALARGLETLSAEALFRVNRIVLQSAVECVGAFRLDLGGLAGDCFRAWVVTGEAELVALATRVVGAAEKVMIPGAHIDLGEGNVCGQLALAYDGFHAHLSPEERAVWVRVLKRFLQLHIRTAEAFHWNCTAIPNANPVCNGNGGLVALALLEEEPQLARRSLALARKWIWNWVDWCNGPDGGNTEGCQYWQYGSDSFYRFALALERVAGTDDGLLAQPAIRNHMNMIRVALSNDGCLHGINDTIPMPVGTDIAWLHAGRFDDDFALWYGDHSTRIYAAMAAAGRDVPYHSPGPYALFFRPDCEEATESPALPTALVLPDIEYGVIRSAPRWDAPLVAFMKGSRPPYTHHNQPDTGAFSVHLRGERLLIDPGYYKEEPECHCLPVIAGVTPTAPTDRRGHFVDWGTRGAVRWLVLDATAAYRGAAARVVRHLVMVGDETLVLLDDIVPPPGVDALPVRAQYQAGGETSLLGDGATVRIVGRVARLELRLLGPVELATVCQEERTLHDTHWGYHFAACRHFPVTVAYEAVADEPLVTLCRDSTERGPGMVTYTNGGGRLVVRCEREPVAVFLRTARGWQLEGCPATEGS